MFTSQDEDVLGRTLQSQQHVGLQPVLSAERSPAQDVSLDSSETCLGYAPMMTFPYNPDAQSGNGPAKKRLVLNLNSDMRLVHSPMWSDFQIAGMRFYLCTIQMPFGHAGKASTRSKRQAPISTETILISDSEKKPTPPPKSASYIFHILTASILHSDVPTQIDAHDTKAIYRYVNGWPYLEECEVQTKQATMATMRRFNRSDGHELDGVVSEKGKQVLRATPLTPKKNQSCSEDESDNPSFKKWLKVMIVSSDEENEDSESEVCREDEPAIDFTRRQRDKNPMFALMANLTDQRDELDHEMERITMCSSKKKRLIKDFIDNEAKEVDEEVDDGRLNVDETLSENDSLNGFIVNDNNDSVIDAEITPQHNTDVVSKTPKAMIVNNDEHENKDIIKPGKKIIKPQSVCKEVKIEVQCNETPPALLNPSLCDDLLKDTYANIPYTLKVLIDGVTLMPISMMDTLRITKNLVYIRGIIELMTMTEPWPEQVIIPGRIHPDKVQNLGSSLCFPHMVQKAVCLTFSIVQKSHLTKPCSFTSLIKEEMQIKELDIIPIQQEWELTQGFYGALFGQDIEDGDEMMVKNIRFNAYENVAFSTRISRVDSNDTPSGYSARLKELLSESAASPRKGGLFTQSSSSEVLPLFSKPMPVNLMIGDWDTINVKENFLSNSKMCLLHVPW
ncbi:uncharacterized protein LAESUDRAFT_711820 [Laetiporus sulphureus 93-53]|uniref:Uncharacterized protein n=1 Tax=Laetiporus sulphureus 93-53 TaxID=1314785 RepID=A0A165G8F3_9APHY|nr:uncharacterized protein LAESUDRAFT_711820 [Laetiporus sulphureus 93-53]KZT09972.1 hypothetical protein LAESUDRAFT_711820 [Laetiporus sulphureus 93-53]